MFKKLAVGNAFVLGCTLLGYQIYVEKKNEELYKSTRVFDSAMRTLRSNAGAIHFLGEPITDGKLIVTDEKKDGNITTYRVKVGVRGDKAKGCMNFWLRQVNEEPDPEITRIELQIQNIRNRLLIFDGNQSEQAEEQ